MKRSDSGSWASNHIDEIERGIYPAQSSGLMSDIKAKSFQNPAAICSGVLRFCLRISPIGILPGVGTQTATNLSLDNSGSPSNL